MRFIDPTGRCGADLTSSGKFDEALDAQCRELRDFIEDHYDIEVDGKWRYTELDAFGHGLFDMKMGMGGI